MTSHEKRVAALMRLHGMTKTEAEKRAKQIESAAKKNPAPRAKARGGNAKKYVNRPSQYGDHSAPSARLKARRKKALEMPAGVFPNPIQKKLQSRPKPAGKLSRKVFTVEAKHGDKWVVEGIFPSEDSAREYAVALDRKYDNKMYIRVTV